MKSSVSSRLEKIKGSLLVDYNWQWIGVKLDGVNVYLFQHFKNLYEKYISGRNNRLAFIELSSVCDFITKEVSRLPHNHDIYREIFEYMRNYLLSNDYESILRTITALDHLMLLSDEHDIRYAISQRKMMKTLSIVGRRLLEKNERILASQIFTMIKSWSEEFANESEKYPYIMDTYHKLRDKHGVVFPSLSPKNLSGKATSVESNSPTSKQLLLRSNSSMRLKAAGFELHNSMDIQLNELGPFVEGDDQLSDTQLDDETSLSISHHGPCNNTCKDQEQLTTEMKDTSVITNQLISVEVPHNESSKDSAEKKSPVRMNSWVTVGSNNTPMKEPIDPGMYNSSFNSNCSDIQNVDVTKESETNDNFTMQEIYVDVDHILSSELLIPSKFSLSKKNLNEICENIVEGDEQVSDDDVLSSQSSSFTSANSNFNCDVMNYIHHHQRHQDTLDAIQHLHAVDDIHHNEGGLYDSDDADESLFRFLTHHHSPTATQSFHQSIDERIVPRSYSLSVSTECSFNTLSTFAWELSPSHVANMISELGSRSNNSTPPQKSPISLISTHDEKTLIRKPSLSGIPMTANQKRSMDLRSDPKTQPSNTIRKSVPLDSKNTTGVSKPKLTRKGSKIPMLGRPTRSQSTSVITYPIQRSLNAGSNIGNSYAARFASNFGKASAAAGTKRTPTAASPWSRPSTATSKTKTDAVNGSRSSVVGSNSGMDRRRKVEAKPSKPSKQSKSMNSPFSAVKGNKKNDNSSSIDSNRKVVTSLSISVTNSSMINSPDSVTMTKSNALVSPTQSIRKCNEISSPQSRSPSKTPNRKKSFQVSNYPTHTI